MRACAESVEDETMTRGAQQSRDARGGRDHDTARADVMGKAMHKRTQKRRWDRQLTVTQVSPHTDGKRIPTSGACVRDAVGRANPRRTAFGGLLSLRVDVCVAFNVRVIIGSGPSTSTVKAVGCEATPRQQLEDWAARGLIQRRDEAATRNTGAGCRWRDRGESCRKLVSA